METFDINDLAVDVFENEPMENWQWVFQQLNQKLGKEVWGARVEEIETEDGASLERMRVFVENENFQNAVLMETSGTLDKYKLVFTVLRQEDECKFLDEESKQNVTRK